LNDDADWASHFVAITDEGTALAQRARAEGFRDVFINPSDIGGRYSHCRFRARAGSGDGQDIAAIVKWGATMLAAADPDAGDVSAIPPPFLGS